MIFLVVIVHLAVLWTLEFFLYPELVIYPYLTTSGFLPYKNILDQHFPGLMFFPLNFYTLGFRDPIAFKVLLLAIVATQAYLIYTLAKKIGNIVVARLSVLAYMIWQPFFEGNQLWLDIFLPLFTLPAFWFFLNNKWFLTGLFLGLGIVFKQTQVPLVTFVGLLIVTKFRFQALFRFGLGALIPSIVMLIYLGKIGVLPDFWYWTVQFNLSNFAAEGSLVPRGADWVRLALPIVAIIASWIVIPAKYRPKLVISWMLVTVMGGIARFGLLHLQPAVPYLSLVFGLLLYSLGQQKMKVWLAGVVVLIVLWMGYFYSRQNNLFQTKFYDAQTNFIVASIQDRTEPGDKIFLLGVHPHIYELTKTLPPGQTFIFQFPWFFKVAGERVLTSLMDDPPKVIVYDEASSIDGQYMRDYGKFLVDYVRVNYTLSQKMGTFEVYESRY